MITLGTPKRSDTIRVTDFLELLKMDPLIIPNNYQREYTWSLKKKKQQSALEVFLKDFIEAYKLGKNYKLIFGNNVCIASNNSGDILHLSDGQQRTTTLFIFGIYLSNLIDNPEYRKCFFLTSTGRQNELRLQHSLPAWDEAFRNTLLNISEEDVLLPISNAFTQIDDFLSTPDIKEIFDAEQFYRFLLYNVYINVQHISLDDEKQYFEDVNTKGVTLDSISSVKYKLLEEDEELLILWQNCIKQVDLLGTVYVNCSANSLLETVLSWTCFVTNTSNKLSGAKSVSEFISKFSEEGSNKKEFFKTMYNLAKIGYDSFNDPDFTILRFINKGNYIIAFYILHYIHKYSKLESINYLTFKYLTSSVGDKNASEQFYKDLKSNGICCNTIHYDIMDQFIYKQGPNKKIRAILCLIESQFNPNIIKQDISAKYCTIEHISSQQFHEDGYNNIGNLTLLTKSENSKLNKLQEKYLIYRDSEFNITKCLCSDYIPINNELRLFRSKYYCKGYSSQEIDSFNSANFEDRKKNLLLSLIKVLDLEKYFTF